jgi:AraC-like DNA-binding protein
MLTKDDLIDKILTTMEDTAIICDPAFSIDKLATILQSNHTYVSQVINHTMGKNFRSIVNSYRIREARRIFAEPDAQRYTIDSVSLRVGYRSPNTFREAFKGITGVNPNFYLKSMRNHILNP